MNKILYFKTEEMTQFSILSGVPQYIYDIP